MDETDAGPSRGTTVTFLLSDQHGERYRVGEVVGPLAPDPVTGELWLGVRVADDQGRTSVRLIPMSTVLA